MSWINRLVVATLPLVPKPIVRKVSSRYIAGDTLGDAVEVIRDLQQQGVCATMDILGEYITHKELALNAVEHYIQALDRIKAENLDSNISVKLTQLGLELDFDFCLQNIRKVVEAAKAHENFVRIDMEDSSCTTRTIEIYRRLRRDFDNVGLVLQAYLRRSMRDLRDLIDSGIRLNIRLCKGIYDEPRQIAYKDPAVINFNYVAMLTTMFENGVYVGIATHDEKLVWHALQLIEKYRLTREQYEFQMLLGVDEELRRIIVADGHRLRVYVPFGKFWYPYSLRRLKENPKIAGYIIQNFFRQPFHKPSKAEHA